MAGTFDDLLGELQGNGWYQKRLLYFLLAPIFFITPFVFLNQIFVLHIPDHWCQPPDGLGPSDLNMSLPEWKSAFLPAIVGPDHQRRPSQCEMYDIRNRSLVDIHNLIAEPNISQALGPAISCEEVEGYEYDTSDMARTAVSDNDWVCSRQAWATNLFTVGVIGLIVGSGVLSAVADFKGRRYSFFISTFCVIVFSIIPIWVSHNYYWFLVFKALSFACMMAIFQSPMNIVTEVSTPATRGMVIGISCITWSIGNCALPLLAWLVNSWKILRLACILPLAFVFFYWNLLPESPRWLITKKRTEEATKIMTKIAHVNNVTLATGDLRRKVEALAQASDESNYGYISLFSSKNMALRTIYVTLAFTASGFVYYQLVINIGNMAGNIFVNMFLLGLVEGPGCALGVWAADRFGRRWSHFAMLFTNAVLFFILMWVVYYPSLNSVVIILCMIIKLSISGTFVVAYVQAMEIFPTSVRQSGIGFCTLISQTISIGGPYVIYLGATDLRLPYMVMSLICLVGAIAVCMLPETLGFQLPETLQEASQFGKDAKFFSYLPHRQANDTKADPFEREHFVGKSSGDSVKEPRALAIKGDASEAF